MNKQVSREHGFAAALTAPSPEAFYINEWVKTLVLLILEVFAGTLILAGAALHQKPARPRL